MAGEGHILLAANNLSPVRIKQTLILHIPEHCPTPSQQKPQIIIITLIIDLI